MDILIAAVLGAIGGLIGGLVSWSISKLLPKQAGQRLTMIVSTVCVVVAITISRQPGVIESIHEWISPKTRVEKIFDATVRATFENSPEAMARLKAAKDPIQETQLITASGVKRLNDDAQLERARLLLMIANASSPKTCAGLFSGSLEQKSFFTDLEKLPDETLQAYANISKNAVELELKNAPFEVAGENEVGTIIQDYLRLIGGEDSQQLQDILLKPPPVSPENDAVYCRATKTFFGNIQKLDKASAAKMLRFIAAAGASKT